MVSVTRILPFSDENAALVWALAAVADGRPDVPLLPFAGCRRHASRVAGRAGVVVGEELAAVRGVDRGWDEDQDEDRGVDLDVGAGRDPEEAVVEGEEVAAADSTMDCTKGSNRR